MSKYNIDLDYVIHNIDISYEELEEIKTEADKIISENKEKKENLAIAYLKKAQCLRKLNSGKTPEFIFYDQMGMIYKKEKRGIEGLLYKALKLQPNMPEALMQLGLLNAPGPFGGGKKVKEKAINFFGMAIRLKPDYAAAFNNRAMYFYDTLYDWYSPQNKNYVDKAKNNFKLAVTDLTEAIRIRPFDALYFVNRGIFYLNLEEYKEAVEDFSCAINYASDVLKDGLIKEGILIFVLRGRAYTGLKDYDKAIEDFSETLRLKPDHDETLLLRGKAYYLAGEKEKAITDFEEYLKRERISAYDAGREKIFKLIGVMPENIL